MPPQSLLVGKKPSPNRVKEITANGNLEWSRRAWRKTRPSQEFSQRTATRGEWLSMLSYD